VIDASPGEKKSLLGDAALAREDDIPVGCPGAMLSPRTSTGTRSLWHYFGLHVVDGRLPRRQKGVQSDWNGAARALVLGKKGIADQIIMHRTEPYRTTYDTKKAAKLKEGMPPWQANSIAKTKASKDFLADMLREWKSLGRSAP
jgi:hypothetical protein